MPNAIESSEPNWSWSVEFRFRMAVDNRIAFGRKDDGGLAVRVTTKGEASPWGWCPNEELLYAVWVGENESRYFYERHDEHGNRVLFNMVRGLDIKGEFVEHDDEGGNQLVFSVIVNMDTAHGRHLQLDRATTARQLYDAFRLVDAAWQSAIESGKPFEGGHRTIWLN